MKWYDNDHAAGTDKQWQPPSLSLKSVFYVTRKLIFLCVYAVSYGCLKGVLKVSGKCLDGVVKLAGRYLRS